MSLWLFADPNCVDDVWKEPDRDLFVKCNVDAAYRSFVIGTGVMVVMCIIFIMIIVTTRNWTLIAAVVFCIIFEGLLFVSYRFASDIAGNNHDSIKKLISTVVTVPDPAIFDNFSKRTPSEQLNIRKLWNEAAATLRNERSKERELVAAETAAAGTASSGRGMSSLGMAAAATAAQNMLQSRR
jgi:hypothetical protein